MKDAHAWFRRRLAAHLLGVLPDDEDVQMRQHADDCDACGELLARARVAKADWWEGAGHLPVSVLWRWQRTPDSFATADRALVASHLRECAECRGDLEELQGGSGEPLRPIMPPAPGHPPGAATAPRWRDLLTGGAIGLATAAAGFAMVSSLWLREPDSGSVRAPGPVPSAIPPPVRPSPEPPFAPAYRPGAAPRLGARIELLGALRSATREARRIPADAGDIVPLVPSLLDPPAARVRVEVLAADGSMLDARVVSGGALIESGFPVDLRALEPGAHRLRLTWRRDDGGRDTLEYAFEVSGSR